MQQLYTFGSSYYIFAEKVGFYKIGCILADKKALDDSLINHVLKTWEMSRNSSSKLSYKKAVLNRLQKGNRHLPQPLLKNVIGLQSIFQWIWSHLLKKWKTSLFVQCIKLFFRKNITLFKGNRNADKSKNYHFLIVHTIGNYYGSQTNVYRPF